MTHPPLTGEFEEFEDWIRIRISGEFEWKIRPTDSVAMRRMLANVIEGLIERHCGRFPDHCLFLRRKREGGAGGERPARGRPGG